MFDAKIRPYIDPWTNRIASWAGPAGVSANTVTTLGFGSGLAAMVSISLEAYLAGLVLFLINRLADGLDGAIARQNGITDLGGFLDIVLDFIIYSAVIFGFALADPEINALAASFLIFSFIGTGGSFLAYAIIAAKRGLETSARGKKSLFYLGGLAEGSETILVVVLMCLFPMWFTEIAIVFGIICWFTTLGRIKIAYDTFS